MVEGKNHSNVWRELGKLNPLRKDLKIREKIGEAGQKDKMTYVSLVHQIKQAKRIDYTDQEITSTVISSSSPSLTL